MGERIIESDKLKIKLLNGATISIRPVTLSERKECISRLPKALENPNEDEQAFLYFKLQGDIVHYIITRTNPDFKRTDVDNELDASLMEQILKFALRDPFADSALM